jgi:hypothetical protein
MYTCVYMYIYIFEFGGFNTQCLPNGEYSVRGTYGCEGKRGDGPAANASLFGFSVLGSLLSLAGCVSLCAQAPLGFAYALRFYFLVVHAFIFSLGFSIVLCFLLNSILFGFSFGFGFPVLLGFPSLFSILLDFLWFPLFS